MLCIIMLCMLSAMNKSGWVNLHFIHGSIPLMNFLHRTNVFLELNFPFFLSFPWSISKPNGYRKVVPIGLKSNFKSDFVQLYPSKDSLLPLWQTSDRHSQQICLRGISLGLGFSGKIDSWLSSISWSFQTIGLENVHIQCGTIITYRQVSNIRHT